MAYYWRARDIPELHDLVPGDRRKWWREAMTCSRVAQDAWVQGLVVGAAVFAAAMLSDHLHVGALVRYVVVYPLVWTVGVAIGLIYDAMHRQPRARRWLEVNLARQMAREKTLGAA